MSSQSPSKSQVSALTTASPSSSSSQIVISESSMDQTYEKLAARLRSKLQALQQTGDRTQYWVAIAGGPGSGKTTTATSVAKILNQDGDGDGDDRCRAVVLPVDGFHYSKEELKALDPPDGKRYLQRRGAPWTMNAELCSALLQRARQRGFGDLPTYCRDISDPVPGGVALRSHHRIVLVEGLYLLLHQRDPPWGEPLRALWDETWFIRCSGGREQQRERIIQRSLETWSDLKIQTWGPGRKGAEAKVDANDALNMDIVAATEVYADVVIESK